MSLSPLVIPTVSNNSQKLHNTSRTDLLGVIGLKLAMLSIRSML
jgi:hypothetical protein